MHSDKENPIDESLVEEIDSEDDKYITVIQNRNAFREEDQNGLRDGFKTATESALNEGNLGDGNVASSDCDDSNDDGFETPDSDDDG